jgi:DNA-binding NarL/FixJ family response regulator
VRHTTTTSVIVVDDHAAVREGLRAMLEADPALRVTGVAGEAREALTLTREAPADVVVLDRHLPDDDGLSLCLRLKARAAPPRVLIYSAYADERLLVLAMIAGADALVDKAADPEDLAAIVRALGRGERFEWRASPSALEAVGSRLDPEDLPVLGMLVHGTRPADIAQTLRMSDAWLVARRWAMLSRLAGRRTRRSAGAQAAAAHA